METMRITVLRATICMLVLSPGLPCAAQSGSDFILGMTSTFDATENQLLADISIDNNGGDMQGFNIDVCHDSTLLTPDAILCGPPLQALNGGTGPGLILPYISSEGIVYGVAFSAFGASETLPIGFYPQMFQVRYDLNAVQAIESELCFCNIPPCSTGSCSVALTVIVVGGQSYPPALDCFAIFDDDYLRGDSNGDGNINIADPIFALAYLFNLGTSPPCMEAADANGDLGVDLGDALYLLNYINGMGPAPPAPFPDCGSNPGIGVLGCATSSTCP